MEELTREEIEQEKQDLYNEVGAEVFEDTPPTPAPEKVKEEEPQEDLSPALREMLSGIQGQVSDFGKIANRVRNTEGKIGELNSQLIDANQTIKKLKDIPTREEVEAALLDKEEMEELKADFPMWAKRFENQGKEFEQKIGELGERIPNLEVLKQQLAVQSKQESEEKIRGRVGELYKHYPNFRADVQSEAYKSWIPNQSYSTQVRATSNSLADALQVMEEYHGYLKTDSVQAKRDRRLAAAVAPQRGKTPRVKSEAELNQKEYRQKLERELWPD